MSDIHPDDAALLEQIVNVCQELRKQGYQIGPGGFGLEWDHRSRLFFSEKRCVCPLGAIVLDRQRPDHCKTLEAENTISRAAGLVTGREPEWIRGFWQGFDRITGRTNLGEWRRGFEAGRAARERLLG